MGLKATVYPRLPTFAQSWWTRIDASPLGARLARGAFWSLSGALISRGLTLVASILVARMLGKEGFGALGIIQSTTGMFGVFAGFGLGLTATKYVAEFRAKDPAKAGRIMALSAVVAWVTGTIAAAGLWLAAPWLAEHTLAAPQLAGPLRISCLLVLLGGVNGAQTGALSGFEAFKTIAWVNLLAGAASFPLMVAGAVWGGIPGAVWGLVGGLVVNAALNHWALRRETSRAAVPLFPAAWRDEWHVLWKFSLPAVMSGAVVAPASWICNALIVSEPGGYGEMGIYNTANQWRMLVLFLPQQIIAGALPIIANCTREGNSAQIGKVTTVTLRTTTALAILLAVPVILAREHIVGLYGAGFHEAHNLLIMVMILSILGTASIVVQGALQMMGRTWEVLAAVGAYGITVVLFSARQRSLGATGLVVAQIEATLVFFTICIWRYRIYRRVCVATSNTQVEGAVNG